MWSKLFIVGLLAAVVGAPLTFRKTDEAAADRPDLGDRPRLVIVSPHNEQIRFELSNAFNAHRAAAGKPVVTFDWRSSGGTSDLRKQLLAEYAAAAAEVGDTDQLTIGYDLFFGGGDYDHGKIARGVKITQPHPDTGQPQEVTILIAEPAPLTDQKLAEIFPSPVVGDERLYHPDKLWIGTAMSSFGIVFNRDILQMLDLPEPTTWADLTDPRYRGWIALADPGHSGSISATYETILGRTGWTRGWATLRRAFANARYFASISSKVPVDVSRGEAAAGMCIDFYGRFQSGAVADARRATPADASADAAEPARSRVGYVDPPYMTTISADPITLLRGAPHRELAVEFILWNLSKPGQRLWQLRRDDPDGPEQFELRRLPIRRDLYTPDEMARWRDQQVRPFEIASPMPPGTPGYFSTVEIVSHAMAIDIHADLVAAWDAIQRHPDHPKQAEMLALFDAMPDRLALRWPDDDLAESWRDILSDAGHPRHAEVAAALKSHIDGITQPWRDDPDAKLQDRLRWTRFFRNQYQKIIKIANN